VLLGCMVTGRVVMRAGPGAVQQFQPGMLFEVRGDLAGMANAVVIADHHDHRGPRERPEHLVQQGDEVRRAAAAQPVHPRPGAHLDRPSTVTLRLPAGPHMRARFRCVSSSASTTARRGSPATMPATTWS
jgi:hypothetical protein